MKEPWLKLNVALLDFISCLFHTYLTNRQEAFMEPTFIQELREKYIQNPPEGMTPSLVKNMSDNDLLDMHYFLTEDEDFDDDDFEEGFYIF